MASLLHPLLRYFSHRWRNPFFIVLTDSMSAHIIHSLRRRRLPLGLSDPRPPLRPRPRLLHRLPQLLRMDIWSRLHRVHPIQRSGANVRSLPPGPYHQAMARLRRLHSNHLVLLCACGVWKPFVASIEPDWVVPRNCWRTDNHHRGCSDAESTC